MNDDEREIAGLSSGEEDLAQRLARLGPAMREGERAEAELDEGFARTLRAHLVYGEEAPHPRFARDLRAHLMEAGAARPMRRPSRRPAVWIGVAAAASLALLAGVLVAVLGPQGSHAPAFTAPYPTRADLIFSFPAPPVVIRRLGPTVSLVHPRPGVPYAGHLRLAAARLPTALPVLRAYRLASPSNVVSLGRRLLGIRAGVRRVRVGGASWAVAADGGFPSHRPLHSLAISLASNELIYHDRRNLALRRAVRALARSPAVTVARRWLARLGWPGHRMPLVEVESVQGLPKVREVEFGWAGVGAAATDAATLWVTPNRSVIEAWVWPPVARGETVAARPLAQAWAEVRKGRLPLAVLGVRPTVRANGSGAVLHTAVVSVLGFGRSRALYLVPTYRFEGRAHIPGASVHGWYSLAPGAAR